MARFDHILTQSANGVKTITLNRPEKRNALSQQRSTEDFKEDVLAFKQHRRAEWPSMKAKV
ncbi:MAG: hypothetical protein ABSC88_02575 [Terracidiphilus sp.]|jgi:enoyl-CoA hydratase/carnithine racemase